MQTSHRYWLVRLVLKAGFRTRTPKRPTGNDNLTPCFLNVHSQKAQGFSFCKILLLILCVVWSNIALDSICRVGRGSVVIEMNLRNYTGDPLEDSSTEQLDRRDSNLR